MTVLLMSSGHSRRSCLSFMSCCLLPEGGPPCMRLSLISLLSLMCSCHSYHSCHSCVPVTQPSLLLSDACRWHPLHAAACCGPVLHDPPHTSYDWGRSGRSTGRHVTRGEGQDVGFCICVGASRVPLFFFILFAHYCLSTLSSLPLLPPLTCPSCPP